MHQQARGEDVVVVIWRDRSSSLLSSSAPNLLTIILDATTYTWTHRSLARTAKDKALAAQNKPSAGPATLEDVISSVLVLCSSFVASRENALVILVATEVEVGIIYPRKGGRGGIEDVVVGGGGASGGGGGERIDLGLLHDNVRLGVAEMVNCAG